MKSVLFFGWFFYPKTGGAESILLNQAKELVQRGYTVSVLTSVLSDTLETETQLFGISVIRRRYVDPRHAYGGEEIKADINDIISRIKPDIVHFHNGSYPAGGKDKTIGAHTVCEIFAAIQCLGIPQIEHAHNAQIKGVNETKMLRELPWDALICVSNFVKDAWVVLRTSALKIEVVYNGIAIEEFERALPAEVMTTARVRQGTVLFCPARMVSLTTGEINQQKNIPLLLDALVLLKQQLQSGFCLVGIANSTLQEQSGVSSVLTTEITARGLQEEVIVLPVIDPNEMPRFYAGADIVCVPASNETFGLMYIEAMAAGNVVIATNTGGPREYIRDGENGFFVEPTDPQNLASLLKRLINDPKLREQIGSKAHQTAQKFTIQTMVDGIERVYSELR